MQLRSGWMVSLVVVVAAGCSASPTPQESVAPPPPPTIPTTTTTPTTTAIPTTTPPTTTIPTTIPTSTPLPTATAGGTDVVVPRPTKAVYSLVISFGSPGDGTDRAAFDRLEVAVKTLPQVPRARGHWGKEGEHDECFDLSTLTAAERKSFVDRARGAIAPSTKTDVHENAACNDDKRR